MANTLRGYTVVVYDSPTVNRKAAVLYRCHFRLTDPADLHECLARAEECRVEAESVFPGRFTEVQCEWSASAVAEEEKKCG